MRSIVLIDGEPLRHRAMHSKGEYWVTQGIVKYFFDIVSTFENSQFLLFWDEGKSRWRKDAYPGYKANRPDLKKKFDMNEVFRQKEEARKHLSHLGVRDIIVPGVEADDTLAWFAEYFSKVLRYDQVVIATRDHDLWQLIDETVSVFDPLNRSYIDQAHVRTALGVDPELVIDWKAMAGDTSDNIKGVPGVGEGTALPLIKEYGRIGEILSLDNVKELKKKTRPRRVLDNCEDFESCYQLVKLPTLNEASSYLNDQEMADLCKHITKTVEPNTLEVSVETEIIGGAHNITRRYLSSLEEEVKGILPWLASKAFVEPPEASQLDSIILSCNRCPLRSSCIGAITPQLPTGHFGADVMIIGRNPHGESDHITEEVDKLLEDLVIDKSRVWMTNSCKCKSPGDRPPTYGELQACKGILQAELRIVEPRLVICLGTEAMTMMTDYKSGASEHSGEILDKGDHYVAILTHPLTALRSKPRRIDYDYGVGKLKEFLTEKRKA